MPRGLYQLCLELSSPGSVLLAMTTAVLPAQQSRDSSPKGIFPSDEENCRTGVRFNALLDRDGDKRVVSNNHRFVDGDRMKFRFTHNRASYVHVMHRTLKGDPESERLQRYAGPKGIDVVGNDNRGRQQDRHSATFQFPSQAAGKDKQLAASQVHTVPSGDRYFTMDDNPGIEKLYLVVPEKKIDFGDHFDLSDGLARKGHGEDRDDSDDDPLLQLPRKLSEFASNAEVTHSKGIEVDGRDGYASGARRGGPLMLARTRTMRRWVSAPAL